jgi:hypothetical protein
MRLSRCADSVNVDVDRKTVAASRPAETAGKAAGDLEVDRAFAAREVVLNSR